MCGGACALKPAGQSRCSSCSMNYRNQPRTRGRIPNPSTGWFQSWGPWTVGRATGLDDYSQYAGGFYGGASAGLQGAATSDFQGTETPSSKSTGGGSSGGLDDASASVINSGINALAGVIRTQQQADLERDRLQAQAAARRDALASGYGADGLMPRYSDTATNTNTTAPQLQTGASAGSATPWILGGLAIAAVTPPGQKFLRRMFK
jgi:hypothetical protein